MPENQPVVSPSAPPALSPKAWPFFINLFLCALLLSRFSDDSIGIMLFALLAVGVNVLGAIVALLRRKRAIAACYGLGVLVMTALVCVTTIVIESNRIEQRPETIDE